jgi:hypothetical protein
MSCSDLGSIGQGVGPNQLPVQAQADPTTLQPVDQITRKIPNPKCRLYRCLIVFIDWRDTVSHVGIFDHSCELAPLLPSH